MLGCALGPETFGAKFAVQPFSRPYIRSWSVCFLYPFMRRQAIRAFGRRRRCLKSNIVKVFDVNAGGKSWVNV